MFTNGAGSGDGGTFNVCVGVGISDFLLVLWGLGTFGMVPVLLVEFLGGLFLGGL